MTGLTNSLLAQQVQALLDQQKRQTDNLTAWLGGSADGGPNLDGRYPFSNLSGVEILVPSPATFNDMVSGPAAMADVAKVAAELARDLAQGHADRADAQRILSEAARGASIDARNLAQEHRNQAGTHEANARYWAEQAQGSGEGSSEDRAIVEQLAAETADNAAQASQGALNAAASAALAAAFEPDLYQQKTDLVAADRITGVLSVDRIPVLPSQRQFMSSGDLSALTSGQQSEIGRGSVVTTTDGMRYVYSGEGSKTVAASYTVLADITPEWNVISNRPSQFPPTAHTHPWGEVTGKPDLVTNGQGSVTARGAIGSGSTVIAGGNADYTGSIGFHQGDGTRLGYIGGAHSSNKFIPFVAENGGSFYFNERPLFGGMVPWDAANLSPVTTNSDQTIFARKIFKDLTSGTAATAAYTTKPLEVQSLVAGDDALMSFHVPGVRAAMFGLSSATGDWQVGTPAGVRTLWHSGNFDASTKFNSTGGNITGNVALQKATPMLYFNDTGASGALGRFRFYSAANNFYFTRNTDAAGGWGSETAIWQVSSSNGIMNFITRPVFAGNSPWDSGNFNPATKADVNNPAFSGSMLLRASSSPAGVFALTVGNGTDDTRALFRGGNSYPLGVSQGTGGTFYLGATNAVSPTLQFCNVTGSVVASLTPDGIFTTSGSVVASGYVYTAGIRVPVTTYSQAAPSGGVDGDVHIVW
jgi:hypothetical protein